MTEVIISYVKNVRFLSMKIGFESIWMRKHPISKIFWEFSVFLKKILTFRTSKNAKSRPSGNANDFVLQSYL